MKDFLKYIFGLSVLVIFGLTACQEKQIVEDPITPGAYGYTLASFTTDFTGTTITEGDTITYTIKLSKMLDRALTFSLLQTEGTAGELDLVWAPVVIAPYSDSAVFTIIANFDNLPEVAETAKFEIGVFGLADKYLLDAATVNPVLNLTINNTNYAAGLTVALAWEETADNWNMFMVDEAGAGTAYATDWTNFEGATTANPEIMFLDDFEPYWLIADGTYFVDIDPYDVATSVTDFNMSVGYPDGTIEFFTFTFDSAKADNGDYPITWAYSTLEIVKTGTSYVCSLLPEWTGAKTDYVSLNQRGNYTYLKNARN